MARAQITAELTGYSASNVVAVTGSFSATGQSASFTPIPGRPANFSLWGTFVGTVQLERSFDAGTTWLPATKPDLTAAAFTAPTTVSFLETESGVIYRANCTAYTSGTINYRISQ